MHRLIYDQFGNLIDICVTPYISKDTNINVLKRNEYSMLFFRIFYYYYVIIKYTQDINILDKLLIKKIFFDYINYSIYKNNVDNDILKDIIKILTDRFEYLYEIFFIQNNCYFNVYFNNLIKYFLPLPYNLLIYSPIITYRTSVNKICKDNLIDYLYKPEKIDFIHQKTFVKRKNIDVIQNELDFHIPIKYFNSKLFDENCLFLIAVYNNQNVSYELMIVNNLVQNIKKGKVIYYKCNCIYIREYSHNRANDNIFRKGSSFEILFQEWKKVDQVKKIKHIVYISVLKKISDSDLFNVFPKIKVDYKKLYHSTGLFLSGEINSDDSSIRSNVLTSRLSYPTYFLTQFTKHYQKYFKNRQCIVYDVSKTIDLILDLTRSIITYNPMIESDYQTTESDTNTRICITDDDIEFNEFIDKHPVCDIGDNQHYVGRRKLQEILFKTRKYDASNIWIYEYQECATKKFLKDDKIEFYKNIYHHPLKYKLKFHIRDYDAYILKDIGYTGFFFTDYIGLWNDGGELMLCEPSNYVNIDMIMMNNQCSVSSVDVNQQGRPLNKGHVSRNIYNMLTYTKKLDAEIKKNIKHLIIGNKYKIIGSYGRSKFVTDVDISNYISKSDLTETVISNIIINLPKNINFIYMTLGYKYIIDDLIIIDWEKSRQNDIVVKYINKELIQDIVDNIFNGDLKIFELIDTNIFKAYTFLIDNAKIKWTKLDIEAGHIIYNRMIFNLSELLNTNSPISHFMLKYDDTFVIFDIAIIKTDDNKSKKYESKKYLTYYSKEWFYILNDIKRVSSNISKQKIDDILVKYDIARQIFMQLYYIKYMVMYDVITPLEFIKYMQFILNNINSIQYDNQITDNMIYYIKNIKNNNLLINDTCIINEIQKLNVKIFDYVNQILENPTRYYLSLLDNKPMYYNLL